MISGGKWYSRTHGEPAVGLMHRCEKYVYGIASAAYVGLARGTLNRILRPPGVYRGSISGLNLAKKMTWSAEAWKRTEHIYNSILELKFVQELGDGTLARDKFVWYMEQDKLYLDDYSRALAMIAVRTPEVKDAAQWMKFSQNAALAEQTLHEFFLSHFSVGMRLDIRKSPTCELYTGFLAKHASFSCLEVAAAAVLPCFWIYDAVGRHHAALLVQSEDNHPYGRWIEMYDSDDFGSDVQRAIAFVDKLASKASPETRELMFEVYAKACVMELMFWKSAYEKEEWPIPV